MIHRRRPSSFVLGCLFFILLGLPGCQRPPSADDDFGPVPDFTLTERSGRSVSKADLHGKVWIAACVFTRCSGACPQITGVMARLQHELAGEPDVVLVSLSVDPEHDTPEVLREYAERQGAKADRWLFLTGPQERVYELIGKGFQLGVGQNQGADRTPGNEAYHSNHLVLVDRRGRIRGYFSATEPQKVDELKQKLPELLRERP